MKQSIIRIGDDRKLLDGAYDGEGRNCDLSHLRQPRIGATLSTHRNHSENLMALLLVSICIAGWVLSRPIVRILGV